MPSSSPATAAMPRCRPPEAVDPPSGPDRRPRGGGAGARQAAKVPPLALALSPPPAPGHHSARPNRRRLLGAAASACLLPALGRPAFADTEPVTQGDDGGAFPRTLAHRWGTTTIPRRPRRVVTLSWNGADFALSLGVVPVGLRYWYGESPDGLWPWARPHLGSATPTVLRGEIDPEAIAALRPDLIEAMWSGLTEAEYRLLSRIAPVLPPGPGHNDYDMSWQQMVTLLGRACGRDPAPVIDPVEARFAALRRRHPDWAGKTAVLVFPAGLGAFGPDDLRGQLLEQMGLVTPPAITEILGQAFYVQVPQEEIARLDADVLLWIDMAGTTPALLQAMPLRRFMRAPREGREVLVPQALSAAMSFGSPLSLGAALDGLEPLIAAAIDGDPATKVPGTELPL